MNLYFRYCQIKSHLLNFSRKLLEFIFVTHQLELVKKDQHVTLFCQFEQAGDMVDSSSFPDELNRGTTQNKDSESPRQIKIEKNQMKDCTKITK